MSNDALAAVESKIARTLASKPQIFITHPAELKVLRAMTDEQLRKFAVERGWGVIRRLGGHQIEFYNDASTRGL
jgi:hypothetical protein